MVEDANNQAIFSAISAIFLFWQRAHLWFGDRAQKFVTTRLNPRSKWNGALEEGRQTARGHFLYAKPPPLSPHPSTHQRSGDEEEPPKTGRRRRREPSQRRFASSDVKINQLITKVRRGTSGYIWPISYINEEARPRPGLSGQNMTQRGMILQQHTVIKVKTHQDQTALCGPRRANASHLH